MLIHACGSSPGKWTGYDVRWRWLSCFPSGPNLPQSHYLFPIPLSSALPHPMPDCLGPVDLDTMTGVHEKRITSQDLFVVCYQCACVPWWCGWWKSPMKRKNWNAFTVVAFLLCFIGVHLCTLFNEEEEEGFIGWKELLIAKNEKETTCIHKIVNFFFEKMQ